MPVESNSEYGRHVYVLPGLMLLFSSPLLTPTAYIRVGCVIHLFVYLVYHAAEHLMPSVSPPRFCAQPSPTLRSSLILRFPRKEI